MEPQPARIVAHEGSVEYRLITGTTLLKMKKDGALITWEFNRDLDEDRVMRMYDSQVALLTKDLPLNLFAPAPIYVCRTPGGKQIGSSWVLIDGQHRLAVLGLLYKRSDVQTDKIEILMCSIVCGPGRAIDDVFVQINSGTPVPSAYYDKKVKCLLADYVAFLEKEFSASVSKAPRPQRPNFNTTAVRDEMSTQMLFRDAVIDGRITLKMLTEATLEENVIEKAIPHRKLPDSVLNRAARTGFYLGLRDGWPTAVALRAARREDD
jgi:hypothetical protein